MVLFPLPPFVDFAGKPARMVASLPLSAAALQLPDRSWSPFTSKGQAKKINGTILWLLSVHLNFFHLFNIPLVLPIQQFVSK
jgi:hypothetical protein